MIKRQRLLLIGTSLVLLAGLRSTQAAEIKIVSPSAYEDREGGESIPDNSFPPYRFQQVFPAADFAALGNKPHWLVDITFRPDQNVTSPRTVHFPDNQFRFATMPVGPTKLSLRFDDNLGSDFKHFYRGPWTLVTDVDGPGAGPREFYNSDLPASVTPYLYDPSQGNLLFDEIAWQGVSPSPRGDQVPGMLTALYAPSPSATQGDRDLAPIAQFTFIPVTPGDYNRDGTVDAADYVVWRRELGTTYTEADYDVWRANFGQTIVSGTAGYPLGASAESLSIRVPEPATLTLLIMAMVVHYARRRSTASVNLMRPLKKVLRTMKRFLLATLLCAIGHCVYAADTDGDGLLDLIDVPGFDPNASGSVSFESLGIQDLDGANLLSNATTLRLADNQITSLENGGFQGLNNLQVLYLFGNRITSLEQGDFQGLSNLWGLGLHGNQIRNLENGAFQGLSNLQGLYLIGNQITSLENGDFQGLSNLQRLYLGYCGEQACFGSQITRIESGAFQGLSNLQTLYLSGNQITRIESGTFQGLSNLLELHLNGNPITNLEKGAFQGLSNLTGLDLGDNQITNLENGVFQGLGNLERLDLGNNPITSLENGVFSGLNKLHALDLAGNNIQKLNLTGATFDSLSGRGEFAVCGFCADTPEITDLILDDAVLSLGSFQVIVGETQFISNVSLVGLSFSDTSPDDLSNLLSIATLKNIRVDQALFNQYAAEFNAFDAIAGNTVTVVPEPSAIFLCTAVWILGGAFRQRPHPRHVSSDGESSFARLISSSPSAIEPALADCCRRPRSDCDRSLERNK